jgi:citrate lyase subunit beta-like protein
MVRRAIDQDTPTTIRERAVRINSVESGLALGDLTEVVSSTTMIPPDIFTTR